MTVPGEAVTVHCRSCTAEFFVIGEPSSCPYCGSDDVSGEQAVRVEPI